MRDRFLPLVSSLLVILFLAYSGDSLLYSAEEGLVKRRLRWLQRERASSDIVLAGVNDETYKGGFFNRGAHAQVITNLSRVGARCVFYDVLFEEPRDPDVDAKLAEAVRSSGICVLAGAFSRSAADGSIQEPQLIRPLQELVDSHCAEIGIINVNDRSSRETTLLAERSSSGSGRFWLSGGGAMLARLQRGWASDVEYQGGRLRIGSMPIPVQAVRDEGLTVWTSYLSSIIYHPAATGPDGGHAEGFQVVPYHELVDPKSPRLKEVCGKIVVVGENSASPSLDVVQTPVGRMKGFEVHAQLLNTLLDGFFPQVSQPGGRLFLVDCCFIVWLCTVLSFRMFRQATPLRMIGVWLGGLAFGLLVHAILFRLGYFLSLTRLWLSLFITLLWPSFWRFERSRQLLRTFIPEVVANQLLATGKAIEGQIEATVIVTDIRGYTTLSESKTSRQILLMLNEYHTETVAIFERYRGHVLNYQGDAQIVIFGYPRPLPDAANSAIVAALATAEAVTSLRRRWGIADKAGFDVGCGICTGPVAVGELGAEGVQSEYTVIGETVRRCHKVQSMSTALEGNVLMDQATYEACKKKPPVHEFPAVQLEGIAYPVTIFRAEVGSKKN